MSRRLPNCAGCGTPLATEKERVLYLLQDVAGKPYFGTCRKCHETVRGPWGKRAPRPYSRELREIDQRGPGRLSLTYRPSLRRHWSLEEACTSSDSLEKKENARG